MSFDPQQFLDQTFTESNDTKRIACPAGEYPADITDVKINQWASKADPTKAGLKLDLTWRIQDQGVLEACNRAEVTVRQSIMLDLNKAGGLDMGPAKNIGLGRLRAAVNLNNPGQPFSFNSLVGQQATVSVTHRIDGEDVYDEIKAVRAFS